MSSSSLHAVPLSREDVSSLDCRGVFMVLTSMSPDILIRWHIYIEECGLRGLCKSKGRIEVGSFLNLADLIRGELLSLLSVELGDV